MRTIVFAALFALVVPLNVPAIALADSGSTTIAGRVLDSNGGLPVSNARVELEQNDKVVAKVTTAADGSFTFSGEPAGVYTLLVDANGYETTRSKEIYTTQGRVDVQLAINRGTSGGLKSIGGVQSSANSLQTTTTIDEHVDVSQLQNENYARTGDLLGTLPFVNSLGNSSVGGGDKISIRGFDSSETATLLDGHPIGPLGAFGTSVNFSATPIWGLSGIDVTLGSGATGMYGIPTIAGAINFQTLNPTRTPHSTFTQGIGNYGKLMTGVQSTGTVGKLGYAVAYGVQGTNGELGPEQLTQTGLLTSPSSTCPGAPDAGASIRAVDVAACTYNVSAAYIQRNALAKFTYDIDPRTQLLFTAFNDTQWSDSTGNGDNDFNTRDFVLNAGGKSTNTLPNGTKVSCTQGGFAVLNDSAAGFECMSPQQYASTFSGPAGGGPGRYTAVQLQDYHGRITHQISNNNTLILDAFVDNYDTQTGNSPSRTAQSIFTTRGFLVSDELSLGKNDASFGVYLQHQAVGGYLVNNGPRMANPTLGLTNTNYFARDSYTMTDKLSFFGDASIFVSQDTHYTSFNPRFSVVYRPTNVDVIRLSAGRSSSEPSPAVLFGPFVQSGVNGFNPTPGSTLNSIGHGSSPFLRPESANDVEAAYGHKFAGGVQVQANAYSSRETNPLVSGVFPLSVIPAGQLPTPAELAAYLAKLQVVNPNATLADLGVSTLFNAGSARYQGLGLNLSAPLVRDLKLEGTYDTQIASFSGIGDSILQTNSKLINGNQFQGIPMHQASASLVYANPTGFDARLDGYYVGPNNAFNTPHGYMYANAAVSHRVGPVTANLGVFNVFNSYAQNFGFVGAGAFVPENRFGTDMNSLQQGSELFGLPFRQVWVTFTYRT